MDGNTKVKIIAQCIDHTISDPDWANFYSDYWVGIAFALGTQAGWCDVTEEGWERVLEVYDAILERMHLPDEEYSSFADLMDARPEL